MMKYLRTWQQHNDDTTMVSPEFIRLGDTILHLYYLKYQSLTEGNFGVRNRNMGNPQEMTAIIYDWLEQLINIIHLAIIKIKCFQVLNIKKQAKCVMDHYVRQ